MKTLINLIHESNYAEDLRDMEKVLLECEARFKLYKGLLFEYEDTDNLFDETTRMLAAAKRGLGITNKLKNPEDRKRHRSRVMSTLNKLRAQLKRIENAISATNPDREAIEPDPDSVEFFRAERGTSSESPGRV